MFIKRLPKDAREMSDSVFGWNLFKCADYSYADSYCASMGGAYPNFSTFRTKIKYGYMLILAVNIGRLKLFKRIFIPK